MNWIKKIGLHKLCITKMLPLWCVVGKYRDPVGKGEGWGPGEENVNMPLASGIVGPSPSAKLHHTL